MIYANVPMLLKAWGLVHPSAKGRVVLRNPPPEAFRPQGELDAPAFAHDGHGNVYEGEWAKDEGGIHYYHTREDGRAFFQHGIDAAAYRLLKGLQKAGYKNVTSTEVVDLMNRAIDLYNDKHTDEAHKLGGFDSEEWRKLRSAPLPTDTMATREETNRPSRAHDGTKVTLATNRGASTNSNGEFVESYYLPFNVELRHLLEELIGEDEVRGLEGNAKFLQENKPYVYANYTAPPKYIHSIRDDPGGAAIEDSQAPFSSDFAHSQQTPVFTWEALHHLPDVFFRPMKGNRMPVAMMRTAKEHIMQLVREGHIESIPNIPVTFDGPGGRMQRPLREALQDPSLIDGVIKEVSSIPAMMFLFGRANQQGGNFMKLYNQVMSRVENVADGLTYDDHRKYFTSGSSGKGTGMHDKAARLMGLARVFGHGEEEGRSALSELKIGSPSPEEQAASESNRRIIEALADHQADGRGHEKRRSVGEIPTERMAGADLVNYYGSQLEPVITLEPHMENYHYPTVGHFANHTPGHMGPGQHEVPVSEAPGGLSSPTEGRSIPPPPPRPGTGAPIEPTVRPTMMEPMDPTFQANRRNIATMTPEAYRQMLQAAGSGRQVMPEDPTQFTEQELRSRAALADPQQTMLTQFLRSEDSHLPVMDQVMKALERMQYREAELDANVTKHMSSSLSSSRQLASYVGLTSEEVTTINQTMGDWHNIAKSYSTTPEVVKVIKMSLR